VFGRRAKYALQACIQVAKANQTKPLRVEDICAPEQLPRKFMEAILLELKNAGILHSRKGPGGGYALARPAEEISAAQILRAVEGHPIPYRCVVIRPDKTCEGCLDAATCPIGPVMRTVGECLIDQLRQVTLHELALGGFPQKTPKARKAAK
jgi:Rrf2 family protein